MMFRTLIIFILALSLGTMPGLGAPTNKDFKIGITQEFENLNPMIASMVATNYIFHMTRRVMVVREMDGKWRPDIIKEIPTFENGLAKWVGEGEAKKLTATFEVKEEAVWGDGKPVTGKDLEFSIRVATDSNVTIPSRTAYENIEKLEIDKANPKKFTVTYRDAKYLFNNLDAQTLEWLPRHLEEPIMDKYGKLKEGYEKNSLYVKEPTNPGLYNGPYLISELKLGSHITLVRNPKWWGTPKPNIEKITLKLIPNSGTLEANLRSGTIDMISSLGFTFDQALAFEKKVKAEKLPYEVLYKPSLTYEHIDVNLRDEFLKDINVRKALVFGLNRDELVNALFEGKQQKALHMYPTIDPWYTDDPAKISVYPYSRHKAQKLLETSGWMAKEDGYRYKDGKKLSLSLMSTAGNKTRELVENYLQDQWKKIGVEIVIKNEPARVFFGETTRKAKYPHLAMYAWTSMPENPPKSTSHSTSIPTEKNSYSGQNSTGWANPEGDKLLDDLEKEFDPAKRLEMAHRFAKLYTEEVPVIPLYYRANITVIPNGLKGHRMSETQVPETNWVEYWNMEATKVN